jgi:hypothetical protein
MAEYPVGRLMHQRFASLTQGDGAASSFFIDCTLFLSLGRVCRRPEINKSCPCRCGGPPPAPVSCYWRG